MKKLLFLCVIINLSSIVSSQTLSLIKDVPTESSGEYFEATFEVIYDMSTMLGTVYLDVSEKGGVQSIEILNAYDFDYSEPYPPGSPLHFNGGGEFTINSSYWLASAWNNGSDGYEKLKMKIRVYPNQSGDIKLYCRASYINGVDELRKPNYSSYIDQQGWYCDRTVTINAPDKLTNLMVKKIEVNNGNTVYLNEEAEIKVTLEETNGVDAGLVDVYYLVNNSEIEDSDDISDQVYANGTDTEATPHVFTKPGINGIKVILDIDNKIPEDDEYDNTKTIQIEVVENNQPPTIIITQGPENNETISYNDVTFQWSGSDSNGTISGYEYKIDSVGFSTAFTSKIFYDLTAGKHIFEVRCFDNKVAYSDWIERIFYIDIGSIYAGEIEFVNYGKPFKQNTLFTLSKSYIYYYINSLGVTPAKNSVFSFSVNLNNALIPVSAEYLGDGILRFCIDMSGISEETEFEFILPDTFSLEGKYYTLKNKPAGFRSELRNIQIDQNIDIFAGRSAGIKLIAGGVGAGPSVAAASLSLDGTGGMGINFHYDSDGNEYITRRFEAGVGMSVESPSINAVIGEIQTGVKADVIVKGIIGQELYFPGTLNTEIAKKAKAAYILETFTLGGVELSPFAGIFLKALKKSLMILNPDYSDLFSDLYYSNQLGTSVEGTASLGFSVASGKGTEQIKLDIAAFEGSFALSKQYIQNLQNNNQSFKFEFARGFDINALNFEIGYVDFGNIYDFKYGTNFSIEANFNPNEGLNFFKVSFGAAPTAQISIGSFSEGYNYDFIIPKSVISKNLNSSNIIGSVAPMFFPELPKKNFKVDMEYFSENLDDIFNYNQETLDFFSDHIVIQKTKSSSKGTEADVKIDLDAAFGVGAGLKLGIHYSYLDQISYPKNQYIVAHNSILPISVFNDVPNEQRLFSIQDEINDVFEGTVLLISDQLNELINVTEKIIESGKEFSISISNNAARLYGTITGTGVKVLIRNSTPTVKSLKRYAFLDPEIIDAYSSGRIIHLKNTKANLENEESESRLYIVSDNYNISLIDSQNEVLNSIPPITLAIGIDYQKLRDLGFGESEKQLAKMYRYDAENLVWLELEGDLNNSIDTVETLITYSASYAIGIEIDYYSDITGPEIKDYYPQNGAIIAPGTKFWAKLFEPPSGVGIDLSRTLIKVDEKEVDAIWNPVDGIISYQTIDTSSNGQHTFEVIVSDFNGNMNFIKSTYSVDNRTSINYIESAFSFNCYPIPVSRILNIEINSISSEPISISIYNQVGQLISNTFERQPDNGYLKVQWDRTGFNNQKVNSGLYFLRIKQNETILVKKIIIE